MTMSMSGAPTTLTATLSASSAILMPSMTSKHEHSYVGWEVRPITVIQNPSYGGSAGDKAFLVQTCACGKVAARDFGSTEAMNDKLWKLVEQLT